VRTSDSFAAIGKQQEEL